MVAVFLEKRSVVEKLPPSPAAGIASLGRGSTPGTPVSPLNDLINALSNGVAGVSGGKATAAELTSTGISNTAATGFLNSQTYNSARPKAFVNWIFLDEQFKYYSGGFDQVDAGNVFKTHLFNDVPVNKSGYLYVYVSNETPNIDVFFDNLQVTHTRGALLEENSYYPFGLTMSGISSKALAFGKENKYKFNTGTELSNKEFADGSGLELYETPFRSYDAQIGRFHQIDPLGEISLSWSPYTFCLNNPILLSDPSGLVGDTTIDGVHYADAKTLENVTIPPTNNLIPRTSPTVKPVEVNVSPSQNGSISGAGMVVTLGRVNPTVTAGVGALVATGAFFYYLTLPHNNYADGAIPFPGFNPRDNATVKPIVIPVPPLPLVGPDNPAVPRTALPPGQPTNVYEIGGWDIAQMKWQTLKYGVASAKYDTYGGFGNRRPDGQLGSQLGEQLRAKYPHLFIRQIHLATFPDKVSAHIFEGNMVVRYMANNNGARPPEQSLPTGMSGYK